MWAQAALALLVAGGFGVTGGAGDALAALYGGGVTVFISGWQGWRLRRMNARSGQSGASALVGLYVGAIQRYAAVVILLGLGLGAWRLAPLPLVIAFAVGQLGYWVPPERLHTRTQTGKSE